MTPASTLRRAFSIVEVTLATLILGVGVAAALNLVASAAQGRERTAQRLTAEGLAQRLLAEVMDRPFARWDAADPLASDLSPEAGETAASWARFNDVGDFNGLNETPPTNGAGTALPDAAGYAWSVVVGYVEPDAPGTIQNGSTGAKRIEVTVSRAGLPLATAVGFRTLAADQMGLSE